MATNYFILLLILVLHLKPQTAADAKECSPLSQFPFLLQDAEVRSIGCHRAVIAHIVSAQPALQDDLCLLGQQQRGGEDKYEQKATCVFNKMLACRRKWWPKRHPSSTAGAQTIWIGS